MKILKLLVASVLMSAMLISCSSEDATTTTSTADDTTTSVDSSADADVSADTDADVSADAEVETDADTDTDTDTDVDADAQAEDQMDLVEGVDFIDISKYLTADMSDEEFTSAYNDYIADCVEAEIFTQDIADIMTSTFDIDTIKSQIVG